MQYLSDNLAAGDRNLHDKGRAYGIIRIDTTASNDQI